MLTFTSSILKNVTGKFSSSINKQYKRLPRLNKTLNNTSHSLILKHNPKLFKRYMATSNVENELRDTINNYIQTEANINELQEKLNEMLERNEWNISLAENTIILERIHSETEMVQIEAITLKSNEYEDYLIVGRGFEDDDLHTINFEIRLSKPALTKSRLQFMCTLKKDVFSIFDIKVFDGEMFKVLEFSELNEKIQHCILKYLKEKGIDDDLFDILRTSHDIFFRGFGRDLLSEVESFITKK